MKFKILGILASIFFMTNTASATCTLQPISLESNITADWSSDCNSTHRGSGEYYAKYYTFTLTEPIVVKIDLTSETTDTYLYLLEGSDTQGILLEADDDGGEGLNSKIIIELSEGNYTIEATTYDSGQTGTFNLSLKETTIETYPVHGTIELPQEFLTLVEDCNETDGTCPSVYGYAYGYSNNGYYNSYYYSVDYNDTSGNYEYSFDMLLEAEETTIDLRFYVYFNWTDEEGNYQSRNVYYSFGADQAIGGTAENMDTAINSNCNVSRYPLSIDLNTTLPTIPLDFSEYILPDYTIATMTINNIPNTLYYMYLDAYSQDECNAQLYAGYSNNDDGSRTYRFNTLEDGVEYGLRLYLGEIIGYEEVCYYDENGTEYCYDDPIYDYRDYLLNDDDGDFTNGGVFVEDIVYDENYNYVFDRTLLAMPEDMILSEPNNLFEPKTLPVAPILYLLM